MFFDLITAAAARRKKGNAAQQGIESVIYSNAGSHNTIYRGKCLGDNVTDEQYAAIYAGTFNDLFIGDYWTIDGVNYRIAAFDYYYGTGDTKVTRHHLVIVPDDILYNAVMNEAATTDGAYASSDMYGSNYLHDNGGLEQARTIVQNAFGNHLLTHRLYLANAMSAGYPVGGLWADSIIELMNERMVYGCDIFSTMGNGSDIQPLKYSVEVSQLPLFSLEPSRMWCGNTYWLRDTVDVSRFAIAHRDGMANAFLAGQTGQTEDLCAGVRPVFCIGG